MNPSQQKDQRIYKKLLQRDPQQEQPRAKQSKSALMTHFFLKVIPLALYILRYALRPLFRQLILYQLIVIFIVADFWLTKNITGRKMIDKYGVERFKFESRVNPQYTSTTSAMLFWIILIVYCLLPIIFIITSLVSARNYYRVRTSQILINIAIIIGGTVNLYFFFKAKRESQHRNGELNTKLGRDFTKKMGKASIISYI